MEKEPNSEDISLEDYLKWFIRNGWRWGYRFPKETFESIKDD